MSEDNLLSPDKSNEEKSLERFGFCFDQGGVHLARTMMFEDFSVVMSACHGTYTKSEVVRVVVDENCLGKPSIKARKLAAQHLMKLYGFSNELAIFRAQSYLWERDDEGKCQVALLVAFARDSVLRESAPFILSMKDGEPYERVDLEEYIEAKHPDRFSKSMLKSLAQNLAGTWTRSGYLVGRNKKIRRCIDPTAGAMVMALVMSYLRGSRGMLTFESEYVKLLGCNRATAIELARTASQRGWLDMKHIGDVVEFSFPKIFTASEVEAPRGQN